MNEGSNQLSICFPILDENKLIHSNIGALEYFGFPRSKSNFLKYDTDLEVQFESIVEKVKPDIIHIFGTEYPHTLAMVKVCEKMGLMDKVVVNIQGMVSIYQQHYYSGLPFKVVYDFTLRDFIKQNNIKRQREGFIDRGKYEIEALKKIKNVIGRTDWDKACTVQINPHAKYYFCNETLRSTFYQHTWDIESCQRHSIFISQAGYPIKGFHFMIEALPIILKKFPNAHIYVTGSNPLVFSLRDKLKQTSYQKYLSTKIQKLGINEHITFLGELNEKDMCERLLKSNVFVLPSTIENSPNSLGEAMLLGVPTVSADVGGVKNFIDHNKDGYIYQHDAAYMLAYYICETFENHETTLRMSVNSKAKGSSKYDKQNNLNVMLNIYRDIFESK